MFHRYLHFRDYLSGGDVEPHWMADGDRFWYADREDGETVYRLVDPRTGTVTDLFDLPRLRAAIEDATGEPVQGDGVPFDRFGFSADDGDQITFELDGHRYAMDLDSYTIGPAPEPEARPVVGRVPELYGVFGFWPEKPSPDGRWIATVVNENLALREVGTDSVVMLTSDGTADQPWGAVYWELGAWWSPDSRYLLASRRANPVTERWPLVRYPSWEEVPEKGFAPTIEMWPVWWWTRGPSPAFELHLFDLESGKRSRVPIEAVPGQALWPTEWIPDGSGALVTRRSAGMDTLELLVMSPDDASVRILESETVDFGTLYTPNEPPYWRFLEDGRRFIFRSERDGFQNLFLYDAYDGLIRQLTAGPHPVRWFREHEATGWVYLAAQTDDDRPYDRHLARVPLSGGPIEILSSEPGLHSMSLSPSGRYLLDHHVASDRPMRTDLKTADGRLIMTVEAGSVERARQELHWSPPEEFSVLAADGVTRLYGTLYKPWDFQPDRSYPVIDYFEGTQSSGTIALRSDARGIFEHVRQALAQLGFIVVSFEPRGGYWRGRDFRLSTWGRGDTDRIPEHVHVIRQLARERPWMDLRRVGAFGFSFSGYRSMKAMLQAPDFYDVGVSAAAPDLRPFPAVEYVGSIAGSEDRPFRPNSALASNLRGRLLLIAGTGDFQGPLYAMMPLMDALVEAGKQFDFRLIPGATHGMYNPISPHGDYFWDAVAEHFLDHLTP